MNPFSALALGLAWLGTVGLSWLGWQLLRQNGRLLLRLEELEKRLDALESGEDKQPNGLSVGIEAPAFELPDLASNSRTLPEFRGRPLLLIFFNPACGFCRDLLPKLAALRLGSSRREEAQTGIRNLKSGIDQSLVTSAATNGGSSSPDSLILVISMGDTEANRQLFSEHKLSCPVLLQKEMEVAAAYKANGTPSGYLISPEGKIASALAIGAEALLEIAREPRSEKSQIPNPKPQIDESLLIPRSGTATGNGDNRSGRFSNHSVARSKIKRDGLKAGTPAPDFRLPRLDGRGELSLSEFRGQRVLLVFSSPGCGPCNEMAPELEKFHRANRRASSPLPSPPTKLVLPMEERESVAPGTTVEVIMISKGEPKENRAKVKEHGLTFPIVLQQQWEISRRYAIFATPVAYLIDEQGVIVEDVAVGTESIQKLISNCPGSRVIADLDMSNHSSLVSDTSR